MKPDASPEEIRAVVNDTQGGQIFSQAVRNVFVTVFELNNQYFSCLTPVIPNQVQLIAKSKNDMKISSGLRKL